jgi:hypothetical protein
MDIKEQIIHLLELALAIEEDTEMDSIEDYGNDDEFSIILKDGTVYNLPITENRL